MFILRMLWLSRLALWCDFTTLKEVYNWWVAGVELLVMVHTKFDLNLCILIVSFDYVFDLFIFVAIWQLEMQNICHHTSITYELNSFTKTVSVFSPKPVSSLNYLFLTQYVHTHYQIGCSIHTSSPPILNTHFYDEIWFLYWWKNNCNHFVCRIIKISSLTI